MTNITIKEYFSLGRELTNNDANIIGVELHDLAQTREVTTAVIVEAARPKDSKLHSYFEWDNKIAAEKFRRERARHLISNIRVRVIEGNQEKILPVLRTVKMGGVKGDLKKLHVYEAIGFGTNTPTFAKSIFIDAMATLRSFHTRFGFYREMSDDFDGLFAPVFKTIDEVEEKFEQFDLENIKDAEELTVVDALSKQSDEKNLDLPVNRRCQNCNNIFKAIKIGEINCPGCSSKSRKAA